MKSANVKEVETGRIFSHKLPFLIPFLHSKNNIFKIDEYLTKESNNMKNVNEETDSEDFKTQVWIAGDERISPIESKETNLKKKISVDKNDPRIKNLMFCDQNFDSYSDHPYDNRSSQKEMTRASNVGTSSSTSEQLVNYSSPSLHSLASLTVNCYKNNTEIQSNSSSDGCDSSLLLPEDIISTTSATFHKSNSMRSQSVEEARNFNSRRVDLTCNLCSYSGNSVDEMNVHMEMMHSTFRCILCNFTSKSQARLNRHLTENHDHQDGEMEEQRRKREVKKNKRMRRYSCKQCTFTTSVQEEIWMHTRVHVPASKLLSCPRCPFVCAFKHHMQYHLNNHFGYKPYKCDLCNYKCNNKSMLNSHLKSHSSDYPFKCDKCSYATKYRQALYIHSTKANHSIDEGCTSTGGSGILDIRLKWNKSPSSRRVLLSDDETKNVGSIDELSYWKRIRSPLRFSNNAINTFQMDKEEDTNEYRNDFNDNKKFQLNSLFAKKFAHVSSSFDLLGTLGTSLLPHRRSYSHSWSPKSDEAKHPSKHTSKHTSELPSEGIEFEDLPLSPIDLSINKLKESNKSHLHDDVIKKCHHCGIIFEDTTLFLYHVICHSPDSPFKCNLCGKHTRDKVEFFVHLCEFGHQTNVYETFFPMKISNQEF